MGSLIWGTYTWVLFHGMAEKINDKYFIEEKNNIISLIKKVCGVLPCPKCINHASQALVNIDKIQTKTQLIDFLYDFHNIVNKRRDIENFDKSKLEKYKYVDFKKLLKIWLTVFKVQGQVPQLMYITMNRELVKKEVFSYIKNNLYKFTPSEVSNKA